MGYPHHSVASDDEADGHFTRLAAVSTWSTLSGSGGKKDSGSAG